MADDDTELSPEARRSWLRVVKNLAHSGPGVHYEQPPIGGVQRGSFRLGLDIIKKLGKGDVKAGAAVAAGMFSVEPGDDPMIVQAEVVRDLGHGSLVKGHKVLQKFVAQVRYGDRDSVVLEHDGLPHDDGSHGWRVRR